MNKNFKNGDKVQYLRRDLILTFNRYFSKIDGSFDFTQFSVKENPGFWVTNDFVLYNYRREKLEKIKSKLK